MNSLGIALVWCAIQVTLVSLITAGVYFAARKLAPTARALAIQTSLLVFVALAALALSPWPQWWSPERGAKAVSESKIDETVTKYSDKAQSSGVDGTSSDKSSAHPAARPTTSSFEWSEFAATFWETLPRNVATADADTATPKSHWPVYLAYIFLAGVGLALLRVVLGLRSIDACRRVSVPVVEKRILEHLDVVCAELNCRRMVELRESAELATPATTGWRRPVIFLPVEWTDWTDEQCRAVLAHEISHIERNDFLTTVCARVGVALHFYHPLVHWLMRRLTLEQELAADADAARVAGGQRMYLTILAEMALLQANRPVPWAARTFLPTRGMFLRRIEMLRDSKPLSRSASPGLRIAAVGVLLAAGLMAAGFRAPGSTPSNAALGDEPDKRIALADDAPATTALTTASKPLDVSYVPSDAVMVVAAHPAEFLALADWKVLLPTLNDALELRKLLNASVEEIEQVTLALSGNRTSNPPPQALARGLQNFGLAVIRMKQPNDFQSLLLDFGHSKPFVEKTSNGATYFVAESSRLKEAYYRPDDRTIVLGFESRIVLSLTEGKDAKPALLSGTSWQRVNQSHAAMIVDGTWAKSVSAIPQGAPQAMVGPIFEDTNSTALSINFDKGVRFAIFAECNGSDATERVKQTMVAVLTLGRNALDRMEVSAKDVPPNQRGRLSLLGPVKSLLTSANVSQESSLVFVTASIEENTELVSQIIHQFQGSVFAAREAARRTVSKNNLKQIGLAMHNYHDVHKSFPSAVVMGGKDGKTPHSWRVELLPYLDQKPLYDAYNMDEPWDSEHNKQVLERMPEVFRHPEDARGEPYSSYYVFTGEGTIFDGSEGTKLQQITDGTSNTIAAVEAKRDIPWTKPEDIPFDRAKDVPALGGFGADGGYNALLADGSVRYLLKFDQQTLKDLIEMADGKMATLDNSPATRTAIPAAPAKPATPKLPAKKKPAAKR